MGIASSALMQGSFVSYWLAVRWHKARGKRLSKAEIVFGLRGPD
jgi:hypothetical protein